MTLVDEWREAGVCGGRNGGYRRVCLFVQQGKRRWQDFAVHVLMMEAFVGPRPPGHYVCHNNGDPADNRLENLRYDTPKGNSADASRHGTQPTGTRHGIAKLDEEKVIEIRELLASGVPIKHIGKRFGVTGPTIAAIRDGKNWRHVRPASVS